MLYEVITHHAGQDAWVPAQEVERLRELASEYQKRVDIRTYPEAPHAFSNETRPDVYREETATEAWTATAIFLKNLFQGA